MPDQHEVHDLAPLAPALLPSATFFCPPQLSAVSDSPFLKSLLQKELSSAYMGLFSNTSENKPKKLKFSYSQSKQIKLDILSNTKGIPKLIFEILWEEYTSFSQIFDYIYSFFPNVSDDNHMKIYPRNSIHPYNSRKIVQNVAFFVYTEIEIIMKDSFTIRL